jgi:hypothetical protein
MSDELVPLDEKLWNDLLARYVKRTVTETSDELVPSDNALWNDLLKEQIKHVFTGNVTGRRINDWGVLGRNPEKVSHVITGWTGSKITGDKFVHDLAFGKTATNYPERYNAKSELLGQAIDACGGWYKCDKCVDLKRKIELGTTCCGDDWCSDIVTAVIVKCDGCTE